MSRVRNVVLVAALAVSLTGCGQKAEEPGVATVGGGPSAAVSPKTAADYAAFEKCLKDNGIDIAAVKDGKGDTSGLKKASAACRKLLPDGGELPKLSAEQNEQLRAYAACMRKNGVPDFPDPAPDGNIGNITPPSASVTQMQKSSRACVKYVPALAGAAG